MATIDVSTDVFCPRSAVVEWSQRYFDERHGVVALGIPLRAFGVPTFLRVCRNVCASVAIVPDASDPGPREAYALRVAWKPTHGGPFPELDGTLTVRSSLTHALVRFRGSYVPPLGPLGRIFDAAIGRHVARISAATLLADVKRYVERHDHAERVDSAFAAYEANLREGSATVRDSMPLHGNVSVRRDGDYVACAIEIDGCAADYPHLQPGSYRLLDSDARRILSDVATGSTAAARPLDA